MGTRSALFSRQYRAALLDYLLGSGETGLARAYDLGRTAMDGGLGLLQILRAHQQAANAILESTRDVREALRRLKAAEEFLMDVLSPFEMSYRGYVALLKGRESPDEPSNGPKNLQCLLPMRSRRRRSTRCVSRILKTARWKSLSTKIN